MTNKFVVIINSLKVPKFKKILLHEIKFLVPNYSCLQNPWLGGYRPQILVLSVLNWICWTSPPAHLNKIPRYDTALTRRIEAPIQNHDPCISETYYVEYIEYTKKNLGISKGIAFCPINI